MDHFPRLFWHNQRVAIQFHHRWATAAPEPGLVAAARATPSSVPGNRTWPTWTTTEMTTWWFMGKILGNSGFWWRKSMDLPFGKHTKSYWKWPFIVDFPIDSMVIFHSYVAVYQRVLINLWTSWFCWVLSDESAVLQKCSRYHLRNNSKTGAGVWFENYTRPRQTTTHWLILTIRGRSFKTYQDKGRMVGFTLWQTYEKRWNTIFNGQIRYFDWASFNSFFYVYQAGYQLTKQKPRGLNPQSARFYAFFSPNFSSSSEPIRR